MAVRRIVAARELAGRAQVVELQQAHLVLANVVDECLLVEGVDRFGRPANLTLAVALGKAAADGRVIADRPCRQAPAVDPQPRPHAEPENLVAYPGETVGEVLGVESGQVT